MKRNRKSGILWRNWARGAIGVMNGILRAKELVFYWLPGGVGMQMLELVELNFCCLCVFVCFRIAYQIRI